MRKDFDGPALGRLARSFKSAPQARRLLALAQIYDGGRRGEAVERGPSPAIHGLVRWRLIDLAHGLYEEFAVSLDETSVSRELTKLGYAK
ncbi:winged helix-turn-helix domain-containing protein, partial [Novosphingobium sp. BW1]